MGPMATVYFMQRIIEMTDAATDQQHLTVLTISDPSVPDRTAHILDRSRPSPLPALLASARRLAGLGACCLAIPCITAHGFHSDLQAALPVPVLDALGATADCLCRHGVRTAGLLATDGTLRTGIFQDRLKSRGMDTRIPSAEHQRAIMSIIYDEIKAGRDPDMERFDAAARDLRRQGAEVVVLGCTELSLIKGRHPLGPGFLDTIDVLAGTAIEACGYLLRPAGAEWITT